MRKMQDVLHGGFGDAGKTSVICVILKVSETDNITNVTGGIFTQHALKTGRVTNVIK